MYAVISGFALIAVLLSATMCPLWASESWKPLPDEALSVSDPRNEVINCYRQALVLVRVHAFLEESEESIEDPHLLLTDLQESLSADTILKAAGFLKDYPDKQVTTALLRFQLNRTRGVWPPWKALALSLFHSSRAEFNQMFDSATPDQQSKLLKDLELALEMMTGGGAVLTRSYSEDEVSALQQSIAELKSSQEVQK